jgi:lysophospholipase L1-like esterase
MRSRHLLLCLTALGGCAAGGAAAEPEPTTVPTVTLTELDTIETLTTTPTPTTAPPPPGSVAIVGDSLTVSAQEEITVALAAVGVVDVVFDAAEGRRINHATDGKTSGVTAAEELAAAAGDPDVWVVALGTNDVPGFGPDSYRTDIEALLAEIPPGAPVIWVDAWIERRIDETRAANTVLREVAAEHPGMTVVDWFQFGDDPGVIIDDGIHLADAGQLRFAEQIAAAVVAV